MGTLQGFAGGYGGLALSYHIILVRRSLENEYRDKVLIPQARTSMFIYMYILFFTHEKIDSARIRGCCGGCVLGLRVSVVWDFRFWCFGLRAYCPACFFGSPKP